ncbi:restriction endonuclease [Acidithiobacillus sp. M4-SHS-6]|uniref:restriction endonuclease n=1 Tax=Acidithiobacillus sp. M4-SHS-6 TaxID=3383024 RepID=UPI0039BE7002
MARKFVSSMNRFVRAVERESRDRQREIERQHRVQAISIRNAERAAAANEKERKRLYIESKLEEERERNEQLMKYVQSLQQILTNGLSLNPVIDFGKLREYPYAKKLDLSDLDHGHKEPVWSIYEPEKPSVMAGLLPWVKRSYQEKVKLAKRSFEEAAYDFRAREDQRRQAIKKRQEDYARSVEHYKKIIDDFQHALSIGDTEAIVEYFVTVLANSPYPDGFPKEARAEYQSESKQLIIAYDLPLYDKCIPKDKSVKYVKSSDSFNEIAYPESQRRALYTQAVAQTALRSIHEIFVSDTSSYIDTIVFNGHVHAIDRGTGKPIHPCIVTVRTTRDSFGDFDLAHVDPTTCLKTMNASVSKSAAELVPVRPVVELNMTDPRFIDDEDVLSTLDQRPNLMDLTPSEFESLITNLFQSMGLETRQTQASRDGRVDCVAFDPRPIFGGKVVIQAKRYKNTVGVSAVRDLFGTMQNEGASKGILVTTSGYGKASFDFASGKPMELLSGSGLLYLLKEHADIDAKIVPPEDWKDTGPDE